MDTRQLRLSVARRATTIGAASGAAIFCAGSLAWLTQSAMLAPPLGATAYLCFRAPTAIPCAPRNLLLGHALGLAAGWVGLWITGAIDLAPALSGVFTLQHAAAAAIATALTVALMIGLGIEHPPAGATTVVVSLGLLKTFEQLAALELGALVIVTLAFVVHRARGVQYPVWGPRLGLVAVPAATAAPAASSPAASG
jgi:CBS domain-containing membrane protein